MPRSGGKFVNFSSGSCILASVDPISVPDGTLTAGAQAGDAEAFAALVERYRPSLYAAAVRMLHDREHARDAVQETSIVALTRLHSLRDPGAAGGWLHAVLRNVCLTYLRRARWEFSDDAVEVNADVPLPEDVAEQHVMRQLVWNALDALSADDRLTVMLRYFSRCSSYEAIASVTAVPVGTVRSRLHRARSQLQETLQRAVVGSVYSHAELEQSRLDDWAAFYALLHEAPMPRTYRDTYTDDVCVRAEDGCWRGINAWSAHEREAINLGVRAQLIGLVASNDTTVVDIDFHNPDWAADHCPPRATFVHRLERGRSRRLDIHYV
jgi:RNA polymerase sigma-70 factor (ECF subfamily)